MKPALLPSDVEKKREDDLAKARAEYEKRPNDADALIWLGRRTAYLGRYQESIKIYTEGIEKHPNDARMYRHRGHRYITVREFGKAIADLEKGEALTRGKPDEIEPDGIPNARNIPVSSLQSNLCYHLGLAYYLKGDYARAMPVFARCNELSTNADRLVSTSYWLYLTLRRLGRRDEADRLLTKIGTDLDVIENGAYYRLLLMFSGDVAPEELVKTDDPTTLYGIGAWYLVNGQPEKARALFQRVVNGGQSAAFGYIAAEVELK